MLSISWSGHTLPRIVCLSTSLPPSPHTPSGRPANAQCAGCCDPSPFPNEAPGGRVQKVVRGGRALQASCGTRSSWRTNSQLHNSMSRHTNSQLHYIVCHGAPTANCTIVCHGAPTANCNDQPWRRLLANPSIVPQHVASPAAAATSHHVSTPAILAGICCPLVHCMFNSGRGYAILATLARGSLLSAAAVVDALPFPTPRML